MKHIKLFEGFNEAEVNQFVKVNTNGKYVQFANYHDTTNAMEVLEEAGIKKENFKRVGTHQDTLKFINDHEFKAALEILKEKGLVNESAVYEDVDDYTKALDKLQNEFEKMSKQMTREPKSIWIDLGMRNQFCDETGKLL